MVAGASSPRRIRNTSRFSAIIGTFAGSRQRRDQKVGAVITTPVPKSTYGPLTRGRNQ